MPRASQFRHQKSVILQKLSAMETEERLYAISVAREERFRESAPQLIQLLKDDNPAIRAEAAYTIGVLRVRNAGVRLYQLMLNDPSPLVRANAMVALAELDYKGALSAILNNVDRSDIREQMAAIKALGKFGGSKAFNQLIRILRTGNQELRESVIEALGELGDQQVTRYLFRYLDQGGSRINRAALVALTRLSPQQIQGRLPKLLESRDEELVKTALMCAAEVGCPHCGAAIIHLIENARDPIAALAADTAAYLNIRDAANAIFARLHPRPNIQTRLSFMWALGRLNFMEVLPEALDALQEPVPEIKATILRILRILRPEGLPIEKLIVPMLRDNHPAVAAEAIQLLSEYGFHRWLDDGLPNETDEMRLTTILQALSWVHPVPKQYTPRIREWTRHKNPLIRDAAITLLGIQRNTESAVELAQLSDPDDRIRWSTTRALAIIRNPDTRGVLESLAYRDPLPIVRAYAMLGTCALNPTSTKIRASEKLFTMSLADGDYGIAFIYGMALLYAPDRRHTVAFEKVFHTLLNTGFNSSRKHEYVDLLFLMDPPGSEHWKMQLTQSPLPRVRARAMVWKAQYSPSPRNLAVPNERPQGNTPAPTQTSIQPPFKVENPRNGCGCHTDSTTAEQVTFWSILLLSSLYALRRRFYKK